MLGELLTVKENLTPLISIVINFHNEEENVDMALACLLKQTYRNFELVLVDDGSTDLTSQLIYRKYGDKFNSLRMIKMPKQMGLRPARKLGVTEAKGEIVVTLDIHTTFDPYFLERILGAFQKERTGVVGSMILTDGSKWFYRGVRVFETLAFRLRSLSKHYNFAFGGAAAYSREALNTIKGLSESNVVEDADASWKIQKQELKLTTLRDNIVLHKPHSSNFKSYSKSQFTGGIRTLLLCKAHYEKIFYPQIMLKLLFFPSLVLLALFNSVQFIVLIFGLFLVLTTAVLVITRNPGEIIYSVIVTILHISLASAGIYYALILLAVNNSKIHVDMRP